MNLLHQRQQKLNGFTIAELLIVITVIAILVALSMVSYTAISNRSRTQAVETDLRTTAAELTKFRAENGGFPTIATFATVKAANTSSQTTYQYLPEAATNTYCLQADGYGATFHIMNGSTKVLEGQCPSGDD